MERMERERGEWRGEGVKGGVVEEGGVRREEKKMEGGRDEGWWDGWMYVCENVGRATKAKATREPERKIPPLRSCVMYTVTDSLIAVPYIHTRSI